MRLLHILCYGLAASCVSLPAHAAPWLPSSDAQVVEQLPARVFTVKPQTAASMVEAIRIAKTYIEQARQQGEPRAMGYAQAAIAPWWDKADAPADIAVLQATILQSDHAFDAARMVLARVIKRDPAHAQALLTLATVERVTGRLAASDAACNALQDAGSRWIAALCKAENQSLRGGFAAARKAFAALAAAPGITASQRAWAESLAAESEERAGEDSAAQQRYRAALAAEPDRYTALAFADLLLRTGKPLQALEILRAEPATDAVLIRRAAAMKRSSNPAWTEIAQQIQARLAQQRLRDASPAHAREQALFALWLQGDANTAWQHAQRNYGVQREAFDAWLLVTTAAATGDQDQIRLAQRLTREIGIVDARRAALAAPERGTNS